MTSCTRFCPAIPETAPVRGIRDESSVLSCHWILPQEPVQIGGGVTDILLLLGA